MIKKIRDLAVKTGEYTDGSGQTKGRYENVGSLMKSDDGSTFILLKRTFNPAGVPNPEGRDSVAVSMFELRDQSSAPQQQAPQQQGRDPNASQYAAQPQAQPYQQQPQPQPTMDDDIPF